MEVVRELPGSPNLINISTRMKQQVAFPAAAAPTVGPVRNHLVLKFKRCFCQILRNNDFGENFILACLAHVDFP